MGDDFMLFVARGLCGAHERLDDVARFPTSDGAIGPSRGHRRAYTHSTRTHSGTGRGSPLAAWIASPALPVSCF